MTQTAGADPAWLPKLAKGEKLLWHGQSVPGYAFRLSDLIQIPMALVFIILSLPQVLGPVLSGPWAGTLNWLFLVIGIYKLLDVLVLRSLALRKTRYGLTNLGALIAHPAFGRMVVDSYPLTTMTEIRYNGAEPGTIWFAERHSWSTSLPLQSIGFQRIANASAVYQLMMRLHAGKSPDHSEDS